MNAFARALLCLVIIAGADVMALAPAAFNARYRTPRRIAEALVIATAVSVVLVSLVVIL
jgi:hypothetical protein